MALSTEWMGLTKPQLELVERITALADEKLAPRAERYDREAVFPIDDVKDLGAEGWLLATASKKLGGLDFGFYGEDPLSLYLLIEGVARANPSTAHCFQVHLNTMQMMEHFGTEEQCKRMFAPTADECKLIVGAGSEPGGGRQGTLAKRVQGGYVINGKKHYITNGTYSDWMWVLCRDEESGEDRMACIRTDNEGLDIDASFWRPTGMRACVSPMLTLKDCFVPDEDMMGSDGDFFAQHWLAKINLGFTANYIGGLRAMYEWVVQYIKERNRTDEQVYQVGLGEVKARIHASQALLYRAVMTCQDDEERGLLMSNEAKWMAVETLNRFIYLSGQITGSTALFTNHPLERIIRDMQVHMLHRRHHVGIQIVGQAELGLDFDLNKS